VFGFCCRVPSRSSEEVNLLGAQADNSAAAPDEAFGRSSEVPDGRTDAV